MGAGELGSTIFSFSLMVCIRRPKSEGRRECKIRNEDGNDANGCREKGGVHFLRMRMGGTGASGSWDRATERNSEFGVRVGLGERVNSPNAN